MYPSMQTLNWPKEASRVVKQVQVLAFIHDNNSFKGQLVLESHKALGDFVILGLVACLLVRISQSCCLPVPSASGQTPSTGNAVPSQHSLLAALFDPVVLVEFIFLHMC